MRHPRESLRDYLVAGIHDPRLNPQSIRGRHTLLEQAFGPRFLDLQHEELHFAATLLWLRSLADRGVGGSDWAAIQHALDRQADDAEGLPIPSHILRTAARLPRLSVEGTDVPDYLRAALGSMAQAADPSRGLAAAADLFRPVWRALLDVQPAARLSVIEPACGSANDYRTIEQYGLARHLLYRGFDLCESNIANARELCPDGCFEVGNVFEIQAPDRSFDVCLVHDLLEHFSPEALETSIAELCRVTAKQVFVAFFQMHEGPDHIVRPVEEYHWNTLSLGRTRQSFARHGFQGEAIHVASWFQWITTTPEAAYYDTAYDLSLFRGSPDNATAARTEPPT